MNEALNIEDVQYVDKRFREVAEYLQRRNVPGTIWRIKTEAPNSMIFEFVVRGKKTKELAEKKKG